MKTPSVKGEEDGSFRRKRFWSDFHSAYAALKADPDAWADYHRESEAWDITLADGLAIGPHEEHDGGSPSQIRD